MDRTAALAKEFAAYKIETDDVIRALRANVAALQKALADLDSRPAAAQPAPSALGPASGLTAKKSDAA